jgi:hypothetical protein
MDFGKYCRSSPFVFSLLPRCHGLWGFQKYTAMSVATWRRRLGACRCALWASADGRAPGASCADTRSTPA